MLNLTDHLVNGEAVLEVKSNTVVISGSISDMDPHEYFDPFIQKFHKKVVDNHVKKVNLDISKLSYLNSAGIKELVRWIIQIEQLPNDQQYNLNISYSKEHLWHEASTSYLVLLSPKLVTRKKSEINDK